MSRSLRPVANDTRTIVAFLCQPQHYPERPRRIEVIETHFAWVFLTDSYAYKLKKSVQPLRAASWRALAHSYIGDGARYIRRALSESTSDAGVAFAFTRITAAAMPVVLTRSRQRLLSRRVQGCQ
jgi:hypothetical protein